MIRNVKKTSYLVIVCSVMSGIFWQHASSPAGSVLSAAICFAFVTSFVFRLHLRLQVWRVWRVRNGFGPDRIRVRSHSGRWRHPRICQSRFAQIINIKVTSHTVVYRNRIPYLTFIFLFDRIDSFFGGGLTFRICIGWVNSYILYYIFQSIRYELLFKVALCIF